MIDGYTLKRPTSLSCPECGGTLRRATHGPISQYICHIGHVLSGQAMLAAQADRIEWLATGLLAMLNERQELCRGLIEGGEDDSGTLEKAKERALKNAETIRSFLNTTPLV